MKHEKNKKQALSCQNIWIFREKAVSLQRFLESGGRLVPRFLKYVGTQSSLSAHVRPAFP
jgi:hypothetical protein